MDHLANAIRCETNSMTNQILHNNNKKHIKPSKMFFLEKMMLIPKPDDEEFDKFIEFSENKKKDRSQKEEDTIKDKEDNKEENSNESEESEVDIIEYLESWDIDIFNIYQSAKRSN